MSEYIAKCSEVVGISGKALIVPDYIDTSKEIVRCENCRYFSYAVPGVNPNDWCAFHEHIAWSHAGFCAWAKRRDAE